MRERERQIEREIDRKRDRYKSRDRERDILRQGEREGDGDKDRESERQTERERERGRKRGREGPLRNRCGDSPALIFQYTQIICKDKQTRVHGYTTFGQVRPKAPLPTYKTSLSTPTCRCLPPRSRCLLHISQDFIGFHS